VELALGTAGTIAAIVIAWLLATRRGSPVEMPYGERIFDAPRHPEQPSPHRRRGVISELDI
jgi:hypothetical protein